jgi:dephospho-CoA kinase
MIVGLTGGIGSGKSTVAKLFGIMGFPVFSSDIAAKAIYFEPEIKKQVVALLGPAAYINDRELDKKFISSRIFSDAATLSKLNQIIHPAVKNAFLRFVKKHPSRPIIKETALLFEVGLDKDVDKIILVASGDEERIQRVMQRDHSSREEVLKKIKSQLPQEEKINRADFVIYNNETESLIEQALAIRQQLG